MVGRFRSLVSISNEELAMASNTNSTFNFCNPNNEVYRPANEKWYNENARLTFWETAAAA